MIRVLTFLALLVGWSASQSAQAVTAPRDLVRASLIAEPAAIEPGKPFVLGLRMRMKPNWHVYWRNPGDSGLPPEIAWSLPAGFSAGAIEWPAPKRIPVQHLMNFGYDGEITLLVPVTPPSKLPVGGSVTLAGRLSYLACEEICIPGSTNLTVKIPVAGPGSSIGADRAHAALFAEARAALPIPAPWPAAFEAESGKLKLSLAAMGLKPEALGDAAYFPYSEAYLDNAAAQPLSVDDTGLHLSLKLSDEKAAAPKSLPGVLTFTESTAEGPVRRVYAVGETPPLAAAVGAPGSVSAVASVALRQAPQEDALTLWSAAVFAFLGGLLLNLMPCVFPVLSIKVLSLVKRSGETSGRVRLHGLAYTAGVLASFLALAGLLIALKSGGVGIGWGFQLQSPLVVAGLAYLLFAMGLSLSGVVHLGSGIAGIGDGLTRRAGLEGSFFAGVLATIVATPCTAPFMGAAVGFALTQPVFVGLTVFASLGLGLALPFLALTAVPGALRLLPRPGVWMETLKGFLAFPVYLTVAWLIWVLAQQVSSEGLLAALTGLIALGFAAWAWERARSGGRIGSLAARAAALAALVAALGLVVVLDGQRVLPVAQQTRDAFAAPFTQAKLDALRAEGAEVFVDMTAAWCITCQVNKRTSLRSHLVRKAFSERKVTYLEGDWTNQNPEITAFLERHGRSGVPLYVLYKGRAEPIVLPQILTPDIVLAALDQFGPPNAAESRARSADALR